MSEYSYLYLHGFASSSKAEKATYLKEQFTNLGLELVTPDFNQDDFYNLTLTRQIKQVGVILANLSKPSIVFGSSMGGLIASLVAEVEPKIEKLILLAPAFNTTKINSLDPEQFDNWAQTKEASVYHYGYKEERLLHYNFMLDLHKYDTCNFKRQMPALVFHGIQDDVVSIKHSQTYVTTHDQAQLFELNDGHDLENSLPFIWAKTKDFLKL
jgi:uncharacterized protein